MSTSTIARADALFQEQIHAQWRDWRSYLRASLTLLDAQAGAGQVVFERAESHETAVAQAQRELAVIPQAQRALFDRIREERRQQLQVTAEATSRKDGGRQRMLDPDTSDRQALSALLAEAEGVAEADGRLAGWGDVPLLVDGALQWYRVHVPTLLDAPGAAAYAAGHADADDTRRRLILAAGLGISAVLFLAVWFLWPRGAARPLETGDPHPQVNGAIVGVWPIQHILLVDSAGTTSNVPVAAWREPRWPEAAAPDQGYWRVSAIAPLMVCLPGRLLEDSVAVHLVSEGALPERVYTLTAAPAVTPDLRIEACAGGGARQPRVAVLQRTDPVQETPFDTPVALTDALTLTVHSITLHGPGDDPTLPPDTARVVVQVVAPGLDWPAYAPTLLLADGTAVQTPEQLAAAEGIALRYLVTLPASDLDVAWDITAPESARLYRWRATLAPPPDRFSVLRAALEVPAVELVRRDGGGFDLRLTLQNRSSAPLSLTRDDITLRRGAETLPVPSLPDLPLLLAPGARRTLSVALPDNLAALVIAVGPYRWQLAR